MDPEKLIFMTAAQVEQLSEKEDSAHSDELEPMEVLAISQTLQKMVQQDKEYSTHSFEDCSSNGESSSVCSDELESVQSEPVQAASNNGLCCRICLEDIDEAKDINDIVAPCRCSGSIAVMHIRCFRQLKTDHCQNCKYRFCFFDREFIDKVDQMMDMIDPLKPEEDDQHVLPDLNDDFVDQIFHPRPQNPPVIQINLNLGHGQNMYQTIRTFAPLLPPTLPIGGGQFPLQNFLMTATRRVENFWLNIESVRYVYFYLLACSEILTLPDGLWGVLYAIGMINLMYLGLCWLVLKHVIIKLKNNVCFIVLNIN